MKRSSIRVSFVAIMSISSLYAMEFELEKLHSTSPSINEYDSITKTALHGIDAQRPVLREHDLELEQPDTTFFAHDKFNESDFAKETGKTALVGCVCGVVNFAVLMSLVAAGGPCLGYSAQAVVCSPDFLCCNMASSLCCFLWPLCLSTPCEICSYLQ